MGYCQKFHATSGSTYYDARQITVNRSKRDAQSHGRDPKPRLKFTSRGKSTMSTRKENEEKYKRERDRLREE
jgi:hypothetical protein